MIEAQATPSIDWLSIHQDYGDDLPDVLSGRVLSVVIDDQGNESVDWQSARSVQVEGSWSSSVLVRCSGGRVEFSGNPSRFGRPDNVWGFTTVRDCLEKVVNPLLARFDLPPFVLPVLPGRKSDGAAMTLAGSDSQSDDQAHVRFGPQLTRVHLCQNYHAGKDAPRLLRAIAQQNWRGKAPIQHSSGSLSWGSRRSLRIKWYDKAKEIRSHRTRDPEAKQHRDILADYLDSVGCLRFELELNRDALRRYGLRSLASWSEKRAVEIMADIQKKMMPGNAGVGIEKLDEVQQLLIENGTSPRLAVLLQGLVYQWAAGGDPFSHLVKVDSATAYRYRDKLRAVGYDIRHPMTDVVSMTIRPRVASLQPLQAPSWYQSPAA